MGKLVLGILVLVVLGAAGGGAYLLVADVKPPPTEVQVPIENERFEE